MPKSRSSLSSAEKVARNKELLYQMYEGVCRVHELVAHDFPKWEQGCTLLNRYEFGMSHRQGDERKINEA